MDIACGRVGEKCRTATTGIEMAELLTAVGVVVVLGVGAWYLGSLLLRVAAFWCFVGAGLLLLDSGPQPVIRYAMCGAGDEGCGCG
jgi:hypothetical protein